MSQADVLLPEFSSSLGGVCCELQCNSENSYLIVWGYVLLVGRCLIFLSFGPCHWTLGPSFGHLDFHPLDFCTLMILIIYVTSSIREPEGHYSNLCEILLNPETGGTLL